MALNQNVTHIAHRLIKEIRRVTYSFALDWQVETLRFHSFFTKVSKKDLVRTSRLDASFQETVGELPFLSQRLCAIR